MKIKCGKCGNDMKQIDITIAGAVFACSSHGSGFLAYYEIDNAAAAGTEELTLQPYMARVG